jgi:hypothetical protein
MNRSTGRVGVVAVLLCLCLCIGLAGCASARYAPQDKPPTSEQAGAEPAKETKTEKPAEPDEEGGHGVLWAVLMYIPNRVIDIFDVARFGVDVGPGIGIDGEATDALQARAIAQTSVGAGFQSFRHMPIQTGTQSALGVGPVSSDMQLGGWHRSPTDFRLGAHAVLVGAHAAIDPVEIADFVLGFLFIDIRDDDF